MKREYGVALKDFLKNREYNNSSSQLKKLYSEYKTWDSFIDDAKFYGFKWSQIYFVKEIFELYKLEESYHLKWLIIHLLYKYEIGNLRTHIENIRDDINGWLPIENPPFNIDDFIKDIPNLIKSNREIFGVNNEPFILHGEYIYINRIQKYEAMFLALLDERLKYNCTIDYNIKDVKNFIDQGSDNPLDDLKLEAVEKALRDNFLIISGGPGTGKTTTIISIIKALKFIGLDHIILAAPTGRAAKRMVEGITNSLSVEAFTLHKLLGIIPNKDKPRYNRDRLLPADAVIIDEASMVDIHMMYRLFDALSPSTKLILVGDKDQLPSVEAGALLGDFLFNHGEKDHKMHHNITILNKTYRSAKGIMDVANLIISGDPKSSLDILNVPNGDVVLKPLEDVDNTIALIIDEYGLNGLNRSFNIPVSDYKSVEKNINDYFNLFNGFTVLTPSRKGLFGTFSLNTRIKKILNPQYLSFYHGEPIMITKNDYINGLFNGDRGVIFKFGNGLYAFFKEIDGFKIVSISKISDYETCYVGTVHKSQGSEFERVLIVIPEGSEKLLTREILYTAITRAKKNVILLSSDQEIKTAVCKGIKRESGIREFLRVKN